MVEAASFMRGDLDVLQSRPLLQHIIDDVPFYAPPHYVNIHTIGAREASLSPSICLCCFVCASSFDDSGQAAAQ